MFKKKFFLLSLLMSFLISLTGCTDDTWIAKDNTKSIPVGAYIYNLFVAYNDSFKTIMSNLNFDFNYKPENIFDEMIDGRNSVDWMKEKAITKCKNLFALDKKMEELGIALSDEEIAKAESATMASWNSYKKSFQTYGISKESYHLASSLYDVKYKCILDHIFGDNGSEKITDEQIENYFKQKYTSYCYITRPLVSKEEDGKNSVLPDDKIAELEKKFNGYADSINNNSNTYDKILESYKKEEAITNDPSIENVSDLSEYIGVPSIVISELKKLENEKAVSIKSSDMSTLYLIYKKDIDKEVGTEKYTMVKDNITEVLKNQYMEDMLKNLSDNLNIQINDSVVKKYHPAIFQTN